MTSPRVTIDEKKGGIIIEDMEAEYQSTNSAQLMKVVGNRPSSSVTQVTVADNEKGARPRPFSGHVGGSCGRASQQTCPEIPEDQNSGVFAHDSQENGAD